MKKDYLKTEGRFDGVAFKPDGGWFFQANSGTWGIKVGLKVTDDVSEEGKVTEWVGWLSEKAMPRTVKVLGEVFGFNGDLNALQSGFLDWTDQPCSFTTEKETKDGKEYLRVKWLNPINRKSTTPAPASDDLKGFIASINSKTKEMAIGKEEDAMPF